MALQARNIATLLTLATLSTALPLTTSTSSQRSPRTSMYTASLLLPRKNGTVHHNRIHNWPYNHIGVIIGIVLGCIIVLVLFIYLGFQCVKSKRARDAARMGPEFGLEGGQGNLGPGMEEKAGPRPEEGAFARREEGAGEMSASPAGDVVQQGKWR